MAGTLALFLPALDAVYLYHDDWVHRVATPWHYRSTPSFLHLVLMGRPVCSLCTFVGFSLFETIDGAWIARLVNIAILAAVGVATARFLEREGVDRWFAAALGFSMLALPGALAIGYWLGIGCLATGWLLAVLAALAAQRSPHARHPLAWLMLACALLAAAAATHQQIAAVYIALFVAVALRAEAASLWPRLRRYVAIGAAAAAIYLAGYFFFAMVLFPDIYARYRAMDPERTALFADLGGGVVWFARDLGPRAAALWFDDLRQAWAPVSGLGLLALALCLAWTRSRTRFGLRAAIVGGAILLAGAPAVLTGYRLETYRLALPISAAMVVALAAGLGRDWADRAVAFGMAALLAYEVPARLGGMVAAAAQETAALRTAIAGAGPLADAPIEIVLPPIRRDIGTDEFDLPSMRFLFNACDAVTVIRRELGRDPVEVRISEQAPRAAPEHRLVIDLRPLAGSEHFLGLQPPAP